MWTTAKDGFTPHLIPARFAAFEPNNDGSQFALIGGQDKRGRKHLMQVVDAKGTQIASVKRESISVDVAWNADNTAIFFFDHFYSKKDLELCRWDIKTGKVDVLQELPTLRGRILGYRNGTLFYTTATWKEDDTCQINQLRTD